VPLLGAGILCLSLGWRGLVAFWLVLAYTHWLKISFHRRLGGITGDVLGFAEESGGLLSPRPPPPRMGARLRLPPIPPHPRRTPRQGKKTALHMGSTWAPANRLVLGQVVVALPGAIRTLTGPGQPTHYRILFLAAFAHI
jgi:hypothetical protein